MINQIALKILKNQIKSYLLKSNRYSIKTELKMVKKSNQIE